MNPYTVLGITPAADDALIKAAWRQACLRTHPDKGGDPAEFAMIQKAWDMLQDPATRAPFQNETPRDEDRNRPHAHPAPSTEPGPQPHDSEGTQWPGDLNPSSLPWFKEAAGVHAEPSVEYLGPQSVQRFKYTAGASAAVLLALAVATGTPLTLLATLPLLVLMTPRHLLPERELATAALLATSTATCLALARDVTPAVMLALALCGAASWCALIAFEKYWNLVEVHAATDIGPDLLATSWLLGRSEVRGTSGSPSGTDLQQCLPLLEVLALIPGVRVFQGVHNPKQKVGADFVLVRGDRVLAINCVMAGNTAGTYDSKRTRYTGGLNVSSRQKSRIPKVTTQTIKWLQRMLGPKVQVRGFVLELPTPQMMSALAHHSFKGTPAVQELPLEVGGYRNLLEAGGSYLASGNRGHIDYRTCVLLGNRTGLLTQAMPLADSPWPANS